MPFEWIDTAALSHKGAEKDWQAEWEAFRFFVGGKMFGMMATLDKDNNRPIITLKLEPADGELLRGQYPGKIIPGYYMNKIHWNTVYLDSDVPQELIEKMIEQSYRLIFASLTKKAQKEISET